MFISVCQIKEEIKIEPVSPLTLLPPSPSPSSSSSSDTWVGGESLSEVKVSIQEEVQIILFKSLCLITKKLVCFFISLNTIMSFDKGIVIPLKWTFLKLCFITRYMYLWNVKIWWWVNIYVCQVWSLCYRVLCIVLWCALLYIHIRKCAHIVHIIVNMEIVCGFPMSEQQWYIQCAIPVTLS